MSTESFTKNYEITGGNTTIEVKKVLSITGNQADLSQNYKVYDKDGKKLGEKNFNSYLIIRDIGLLRTKIFSNPLPYPKTSKLGTFLLKVCN